MPRRAPRPIRFRSPRTTYPLPPRARCEWPLPARNSAPRFHESDLRLSTSTTASASESCADKWARGGPGPDFCPRCQRSWEQGRGGGGRWIRTNQTGSDKWVGFNLRPINILVLLSYPLSRPFVFSSFHPSSFRCLSLFLPHFLPVSSAFPLSPSRLPFTRPDLPSPGLPFSKSVQRDRVYVTPASWNPPNLPLYATRGYTRIPCPYLRPRGQRG